MHIRQLIPAMGALIGLAHTAAGQQLTTTTTDARLASGTSSETSSLSTSGATVSSGSSTISNTAITTTSVSVFGMLTNAPTLYSIPSLIVPDTSGAPFMQKSNLPEGFVFICVGGILGFLGIMVLLWRAAMAWALRSSVKRTASDRFMSEKLFAPIKLSNGDYDSSSMSLENLAMKDTAYAGMGDERRLSKTPGSAAARAQRRVSKVSMNSSPYFSPTVGAGPNANRSSSFLPAGYYASGSSNLGGPVSTITSTSAGPPAGGYQHIGESPPNTPCPRPQQSPDHAYAREARNSTMDTQDYDTARRMHDYDRTRRSNIKIRSSQRAPSTAMDNLFQHHPGRQ